MSECESLRAPVAKQALLYRLRTKGRRMKSQGWLAHQVARQLGHGVNSANTPRGSTDASTLTRLSVSLCSDYPQH